MSNNFKIEKEGYTLSFIGTDINKIINSEIELSEFSNFKINNKDIEVRLLCSIDRYNSIFTNDQMVSYLIETLLRVEKYRFNLKWKILSFIMVMFVLLLVFIPLIGDIQSVFFRMLFYMLLTLILVTCAFIVTRKNTKISFDFKKTVN
jgi:hypothetical protein